jgi:predicted site-specific integrase-resolvase
LLAQIDFLQSRYAGAEVIQDIGSGLNYRRKGFLSLLERILSNDVGLVVVANKDRLCRFGFALVAWLCERQKCELLVLNQSSLSPEREMVEDARREVVQLVETIPHELRSRLLQEILSSCSRVKES